MAEKKRTPEKAKMPVGDWGPAFLAALAETANVRYSCRQAGIARRTAYDRRDRDEPFRAAWDDALEDACDRLEEIAAGRAESGSDTLMIFLLKAHRPEKYRESVRHEHAGSESQPVVIRTVSYVKPPDAVQ